MLLLCQCSRWECVLRVQYVLPMVCNFLSTFGLAVQVHRRCAISNSTQRMENLSKKQLDNMTKADLVARLETVQKELVRVDGDPNSTPEQKQQIKEDFTVFQRAKEGIKRGAYWFWDGCKRVYISVKTFLGRLFQRIKAFMSTVWTWLKGIARVVIDACVSAFKALGNFLGRIIARFTGGVQDVLDKGVRIAVPSQEDDQDALVRETLAETKRLDRPDLEERCERATEQLEASAAAVQ